MTDSPDFDLSDFLPYRLAVLAERVSRDFAALYRERFGISRAEWRVLAHLSQAQAVSVRDIHAQVDLEKSKVSRAASRLEAEGYLTKTENASDRRLVSLALTPKGWDLMAEMVPVARAFETDVLTALGSDAEPFLNGVHRLTDRPQPAQPTGD